MSDLQKVAASPESLSPPAPAQPERVAASIIVVAFNGREYLPNCLSSLLDQDFPVVAICTDGATRDKMASNVHEVAARGAPVLALVTQGDHHLDDVTTDRIEIPACDEAAVAILNTVVLQLFAYHVAVELGRDVDQPRNLAKSVTVE